MTPLLKMEDLAHYYDRTRGIGHTRVLLQGIGDEPVMVMFDNMHMASILAPRDNPNILPIAWSTDLARTLIGRTEPLVLDNSAVTAILRDAMNEIRRLKFVILSYEETLGLHRK